MATVIYHHPHMTGTSLMPFASQANWPQPADRLEAEHAKVFEHAFFVQRWEGSIDEAQTVSLFLLRSPAAG